MAQSEHSLHAGKPMELLAPAGGMEQLRAAILFGADAVYLAGPEFGMRARAANFSMEGIVQAVQLAHASGVKVHLTCNVMINQSDLSTLPAFLEQVDAAGVDALIIGDMGAFSLAREHAPHCELHVSTQASVANAEAAKMWHSLGASRIVCAREMSVDDIASMRRSVPEDLQIEAFVHGAQCMAVSGRCLISSYLADRSGSRGDCTQPCRWNYALVEEKRPGEFIAVDEDARGSYIMNAMDLNMVEHLDRLRDAGVDSIKIEGRNKKAFYVATVVSAYRRALDEGFSSELADELACISHRPYSTGFYFGHARQAADYDGYEQETLHVADVLACEVLPDGAASASSAVDDERGRIAGADVGNRVAGAVDDAGVASQAAEADTGCGLATAASAALSGESADSGARFELRLRCRNRFFEGDELEVLSPKEAVRKLTINDLRHMGSLENGGSGVSADTALGVVEVANRTSDAYAVLSPIYIQPGSLIRRRIYRRTARHL